MESYISLKLSVLPVFKYVSLHVLIAYVIN